MPRSLESLIHEAYVGHFGSVASALQVLDSAIQTQYPKAEAAQPAPSIESGVLQFYYTGDGYIDPQTLYAVSVHSAKKDRTGLIDGFPRPDADDDPPSETIQKAYDTLANIASPDSGGVKALETILERSCPDEIQGKTIAVRRPLYVFRLAPNDSEPDSRTRYAGDTVALPEIVNGRITRLIGEQVVVAQHTLSLLAGNPEVAKAASGFRSLHHQLSRVGDTRDPFWAPLRTYKEGVVTAAQAISFLSEGITDEAKFLEALDQWRQDKTIETIAFCLSGAVLGPLATHGAQPKGELVRAPNGAMRQDFKAAIQAISRERKQKQLTRSIGGVLRVGIDAAALEAITPAERAKKLIEKNRFFLPGWGCLAPAPVIRRAADLALARVTQPETD